MPYFNIANIDGDFDLYDDEDYSDFDEEEFDREVETECFACHGIGIGYSPDSSCCWCNGSGIIKHKK